MDDLNQTEDGIDEDIFAGPRYPDGTICDPSERLKYVNQRSESPIEHKFAWSLIESHRFVILPAEHAEHKLPPCEYGVVMQYPVGPYRLDMALFVHPADEPMQKIAIECDGERFHTGPLAEKRDQIRDRYLRGVGFQVWRYPGWLLHHGAEVAAEEVHRAVQEIAYGREPLLTFTRNRDANKPSLREYEAAFWAFSYSGVWPARMGKNPTQRGWRTIEDLFDWAREQVQHQFPELGSEP